MQNQVAAVEVVDHADSVMIAQHAPPRRICVKQNPVAAAQKCLRNNHCSPATASRP